MAGCASREQRRLHLPKQRPPLNLTFRCIEPAPDLAAYVRHYWILLGGASGGPAHPVFPDGCGEIVFNLGSLTHEREPSGRLAVQPRAMLVGQMTRPLDMVPGGDLRIVGIKLAPWGAAAIVGEASSALRDRTIALSDVDPALLARSGERLEECRDDDQVRAVLDRALRARLEVGGGERLDRLASFARSWCGNSRGSVDALARNAGCSARTLERRFDRFVGISPKEFSRIRRFQRALRLAREQPMLYWSTIAARAGYSDQSHLVRDFRQFAGRAPTLVAPTCTPITAAFLNDEA
jgi:AraC-like DNA-binding protein